MTSSPAPPSIRRRGCWPSARHVFQVERQGLVVQATPTTPAEELRLIREVFHLDPGGIYEDAPAEGEVSPRGAGPGPGKGTGRQRCSR